MFFSKTVFFFNLLAASMVSSLSPVIDVACDDLVIATFDDGSQDLGRAWNTLGTQCGIRNGAVSDVHLTESAEGTGADSAVPSECWAQYLPETNAIGARVEVNFQGGNPIPGILLGLKEGEKVESAYDNGYGVLIRLVETEADVFSLVAYNGRGDPVGDGVIPLSKPGSEFKHNMFTLEASLDDKNHLTASVFGFSNGSDGVVVDFGEYSDFEKMGPMLGFFIVSDKEAVGSIDSFTPLCPREARGGGEVIDGEDEGGTSQVDLGGDVDDSGEDVIKGESSEGDSDQQETESKCSASLFGCIRTKN